MSAQALLEELDGLGLELRVKDDKLAVLGDTRLLADARRMAALRTHKQALIGLLRQREGGDPLHYRIAPGTRQITPQMLPLVQLSPSELAALLGAIPGGAANVQDIYPLAPLQEGLLYHHRLQREGDTYVVPTLLRFDSRARLEAFVQALNQVIARHDILRTSVHWQGLAEPLQVVWREAPLLLQTETRAPGESALERLQQLTEPRVLRLDLGQAPLLRALACDEGDGHWLLQLLHHHLIMDHRSSELLVQEVLAILQGRGADLPSPLPFRALVVHARRGLSTAAHEAYFRRQLGDVDEPTAAFSLFDLQGDGSTVQRRGAHLGRALAGRLREQAQARGVSAASLFHLAWAKVLACGSGRDDLVFGSVLFGRLHGGAAADRALGLFLNTLPLRVRLGQDSVEQGLKRTHAALAELLHHEHAPLSLAQRCSALPADRPLFTSLLNYRYSHAGGDRLLEGIEHLGGDDRTHYPLSVDIDDLGDDFLLTLHVAPPADGARLLAFTQQAVTQLVEALEQRPDLPLSQLDGLPEAERQQVLQGWNATAGMRLESVCLHQLVEARVVSMPQAVAVEQGGRQLTYAALNAQANRLAWVLIEQGLRPDALVALHGHRSPDLLIAMLAVLKAGGAYLPLDPDAPRERLALLLRDSAPGWLIGWDACLAPWVAAPDGGPRLVDLRDAAVQGRAPRDDNPEPLALGLHPGHLAYLIYTSGSTGRPKGVMVEHRAVVNEVRAFADALGLHGGDRVLQFAAPGFDVSVEDIFATLARGATLVLRNQDWLVGGAGFWALCEGHRISVLNLPTQFWGQLAQADARVPACVRSLVIGGDALGEAAWRAWFAGAGWRPALYNGYGPTETTVTTSLLRLQGHADEWRRIGGPLANTRFYVLDKQRQPVPIGVAGELYIGGAQLARGYLNQPELTAECFLEDPFVPGERLYRTGDRVSWHGDGSLTYLGREDFQVKVRGYRLELGELEAQLLRLDGVAQAVVAVREEAPGDQRLVAYLVPQPGSVPQPAALRAQLAQWLPDYAVPAAYVCLPQLPLLASGKLDRRALPVPTPDAFARQAYEAPVGEVEVELARIWRGLLGTEEVSRHDSFFALGGHSLLAVQLLEQLRQRHWSIDIRALFAQPALAAMAAAVQRAPTPITDAMPRSAIPDAFAALALDNDIEELRL
ncbi:MAG: amino acid adenylation domain-containing protein [Pseudomonas sp.]|uniref:non-ribosomal peptide synthetase n=1 Tax=Pseudomonas sp. TaxID=306 RepID=UPI0033949F1E